MSRDTKGIIGFTALSLLLGIIVHPFMVAREIYQSRTGHFPLEWEDIINYTVYIAIGSIFHWCICDLLSLPVWTWF